MRGTGLGVALAMAAIGEVMRPDVYCDGERDVLDVRAQRKREYEAIKADRIERERLAAEAKRAREQPIIEAAEARRARRNAKRAATLQKSTT